jgi:hypothetical protein
MCPANAGIRAGNHDGLPSEPKRPYVRRIRVIDARLDRLRRSGDAGLQRRLLDRTTQRKVILDHRIAFKTRHVRTGRQCFGNLPIACHQDHVNDIEGAMLDVALAQPLQDRFLRALGLV